MYIFLLFGFYSLLAQVLLLREISQVFGSHELSLSAALASWLLWTAAGASGRVRTGFGGTACLFTVMAAADLLLARLAPVFLPGLSQPGLFTILAGSLLLCLPAGLVNGMAAAAGLQGAPARFYAAEAAGAAAAGLGSALYFRYLPGPDPVYLLTLPALALCAGYAFKKPASYPRFAAGIAAAAALGLAALAGPHAWRLKPPAPRPGLIIQTEGSRLALAGGGELSFYEDGELLHAPGDTAPEELAHIPLLSVKKPDRVLLSGSGAFFLLPEVLKHKPGAVEIAEPDHFKARALERETHADKKTFNLITEDPRQLKGRGGAYDLIFQTASPPDNAALNRYFTLEYFRAAAAILKPGGLLVFQLPFAENYVPKETAYAAACVLASARAVFRHTEFIPGARLTVLASEFKPALEPPALAATYARRGIKNRTVVPSALPFLLDPYRRAWAEGELARVKDPPLNTDLNPLAYFRFWRAWLSMVASPSSLLGLAAILLAACFAAARLLKPLKFTPGDRSGEAFLMGFWGMAFETALLLAFQAETGRLNPELGLLFAVFMAGGAAGARLGGYKRPGVPGAEAAAALMAAACAAAAPALFSAGRPVFWLLAGGSGIITGYFFVLAAGKRPAGVYTADLAGGAAGGFVTAAFAAPLAGISGALYVSAAAAAAALTGGIMSLKHKE